MSTRRQFMVQLGGVAAAGVLASPSCEQNVRKGPHPKNEEKVMKPSTKRMPVIFAGHGSPMNAIQENRWSQGFKGLSRGLERPRAILVVSAHWYVSGTYLTGSHTPKTLHDFGGFPQALFEVEYPAPGHVDLAKEVRKLLGEDRAALSSDWGLDHGAWSVLCWMYPDADVPVIQLSMSRSLDAREHFEMGRSLASLREEGVLIVSSGNMVHNLRDAFDRARRGDSKTPSWATEFDEHAAKLLVAHEYDALVKMLGEHPHATRAHPTPEHWLPLLYAAGASDVNDEVSFSSDDFDWGSLSMRNVYFG